MGILDSKGLERVITKMREEIAAAVPKKAAPQLRFQRGIISYYSEPYVVYRNTGEMRLPMPKNTDQRVFDMDKHPNLNFSADRVISNAHIEVTANSMTKMLSVVLGRVGGARSCVRYDITPLDKPFVYFDKNGYLCGLGCAPAEGMLPPLSPVLGYPHSRKGVLPPWEELNPLGDWTALNSGRRMRDFFAALFGVGGRQIEIQRYCSRKKYRPTLRTKRVKSGVGCFQKYHDFRNGVNFPVRGIWRVRRVGRKKRKSAWIIVKFNSIGLIRIEEPNK